MLGEEHLENHSESCQGRVLDTLVAATEIKDLPGADPWVPLGVLLSVGDSELLLATWESTCYSGPAGRRIASEGELYLRGGLGPLSSLKPLRFALRVWAPLVPLVSCIPDRMLKIIIWKDLGLGQGYR